jgi:hypothetical protein
MLPALVILIIVPCVAPFIVLFFMAAVVERSETPMYTGNSIQQISIRSVPSWHQCKLENFFASFSEIFASFAVKFLY